MPAKPRLVSRQSSFDHSPDKAAAALVRRVLVAHQINSNGHIVEQNVATDSSSIDSSLPPLTSSNAIDLQLYALIAILLKDCVYSWYSRFTSDHAFVDDVVQIIAHCTRALEERLRRVDMERLLLNDLPEILDEHIHTFKSCRRLAQSTSTEKRLLYTTMRAHPALLPLPSDSDPASIPQQREHDNTYRQLLAQGILTLLLPTDDLRNSCLRSMMTEVLGDMILGNFVSTKLCDAVFIYDMIRRAAESSSKGRKQWAIDTQVNVAKGNRLEHFGLLAEESSQSRHIELGDILQIVIVYGLLAFKWIRHCLDVLIWTTRLPKRRSGSKSDIEEHGEAFDVDVSQREASKITRSSTEFMRTSPVVEYHLWQLLGNVVDFATKMPWLAGVAALLKHQLLYGPGRIGSIDGYFDRIVAHYLLTPIFPISKHLPGILFTLRTTLFPKNTLPRPPPAASVASNGQADAVDSALAIRHASRAAAFAILNAIPQSVARAYFAPSSPSVGNDHLDSPHEENEQQKSSPVPPLGKSGSKPRVARGENEHQEIEHMVDAIEQDILAPFGTDEYLTRHLVYNLLDRVVLEVFPELGVKGIDELLAERDLTGL